MSLYRSLRHAVLSAALLGMSAPSFARAQNPNNDRLLQSFMSPGSLSILTGISFTSLQFSPNTIGFDLRQFNGSVTIGPSLFYFFEPNGRSGDALYTLTPNVVLAPNTTYGIALELNGLGISTGIDNAFAGGTLYQRIAGAWVDRGDDAAGFQVSFQPVATTVPEPTTFTLIGTGLAGLALLGRLRRRSVSRRTGA
jgi:hypothetical protein